MQNIKLVLGDITELEVDAIVNAANNILHYYCKKCIIEIKGVVKP